MSKTNIQESPSLGNSSATTPYNERKNFAPKKWSDETAAAWCTKHKPGVTVDSLKRAGAQIGTHWFGPDLYPVIVLPVFGSDLSTVIGQVAWHLHGKDLPIFNGVGNSLTWKKMKTLRGSKAGWMGAVAELQAAEVVLLTEGPPDALTIDAIIPAEFRGEHVVLTNSGGCSEDPDAYLQHLAGKAVYVIRDADKPGEASAAKWSQAVCTVANECRNPKLPYPIAESHGKDARDFINEGGTYQQLLELAAKAEPVVVIPKPPPAPRKEGKLTASLAEIESADWEAYDRAILDQLDILKEYEAMGLQTIGRPNHKGEIKCRAIGRDDKNPSGEINVGTGEWRGWYTDWVTGYRSPFLKFAKQNVGKDRKYFARKTGVKPPKSKIDKLMEGLGSLLSESPPPHQESPRQPPQQPQEPTKPPQTLQEARAKIETIKANREVERLSRVAAWQKEMDDELGAMNFGSPDSRIMVPETAAEAESRLAQKEVDRQLRAEILARQKTRKIAPKSPPKSESKTPPICSSSKTPLTPVAETTCAATNVSIETPSVTKASHVRCFCASLNLTKIFGDRTYKCTEPKPRLFQEKIIPRLRPLGKIFRRDVTCGKCIGCRNRNCRDWVEWLAEAMQYRIQKWREGSKEEAKQKKEGKRPTKYLVGPSVPKKKQQRFHFAFVPKKKRRNLIRRLGRDVDIANLEVVELPGKEMLVITDGPWKWNKGGRLVRARRCTLEVAVRKVATAIAKMKPSQFIKRQPIKASENWRRQKPESKGLVVLGIPTKKCRPDKELAEIFGVPGDFSKYPLRGFSDDRFGTKFGEATKPDDELLDLCGIIPRSKLNDLRKAKSKSSSSTPLPPPKSTTCMHEATELRDGKKYCLTCESFLGYNYEHPNLFSTNKTRTGKDVGTHAASETDSTLSC